MEHQGRYIPNRLRKHRKILGYRQKDVAKALGMQGTARISQWEQGLAFPGIINLLKLSILYHTLPTDLYFDLFTALRNDLCVSEDQLLIQENEEERNQKK